jgi:antitoxin (DNA-binding transcriptional repressor) of toxin-antitoxin stability system
MYTLIMNHTTNLGILDLRNGTKIKQLLKQNKPITITDRGQPIATLTPLPTKSDQKRIAAAITAIKDISKNHEYPLSKPLTSENIYE